MSSQNFTTRERLADELGCHPRTLKRKLQKLGYQLPPGLVSVTDAATIKKLLLQKIDLEDIKSTIPREKALTFSVDEPVLNIDISYLMQENSISSDEALVQIGT